jgi:hypothetical protein
MGEAGCGAAGNLHTDSRFFTASNGPRLQRPGNDYKLARKLLLLPLTRIFSSGVEGKRLESSI